MNRKCVVLGLAGVLLLSGVPWLAAQENKSPLLPGLVATATDGERKVVFVAPTPNFNLTASQSVHPQLKPLFKAGWNGFLTVVRGGKYTINCGAHVFVDGKEIQGRSVQLTPDEHPVRIEFEHKTVAPVRLQLLWQSDFFKQEPIPASAFGHRGEPAEVAKSAKFARGRELVEELNCIGCHKIDSTLFTARHGPDLSAIGSRVNGNWIFKWLENPKYFRAAAVMPVLLENVQDRADVTAYLDSLKAPQKNFQYTGTTAASIGRGKELFSSVGCLACHGEAGADLNGVGSKYRVDELANYLFDPLAIDPSGRMPNMNLSKEEALALADYLTQLPNKELEEPAPQGNPMRGQQLVETSGCLNCHLLNDSQGKIETKLMAAPLKGLAGNKGCLAANPSGKAAHFNLTEAERDSLTAFLKSPDISEAPAQDFHRLINRFHCNACHELTGPALVAFDQPLAPLTDAGNKLRASWLDGVLSKHKRIRPWMALRMPHFGELNMHPLVDLFAAQAGAELGEGETIAPPTTEQIQDGIKLIGSGEGGLSCISCHDFAGEKSVGDLRGPDMTEMFGRIRTDWLRRWLREPARIQAGTAMPAFFNEMPEASAEKMISQITHALWAGNKMPRPAGFDDLTRNYTLVVKDEPILLRTFMPDSSPQSIAVGLPGGQSYCFDAHLCRLRYAWSGGFLDVKPVWTGRGGQNANILGKKYYTAPNIFPLRMGDPDKEAAVKFRGYKLVNETPEFMYEVDGVLVRERIAAAVNGSGLVCSFEIGPVTGDIWFLAGQGEGATVTSSMGEFSEGRLKIPGGKPVRFDVTILAK